MLVMAGGRLRKSWGFTGSWEFTGSWGFTGRAGTVDAGRGATGVWLVSTTSSQGMIVTLSSSYSSVVSGSVGQSGILSSSKYKAASSFCSRSA